MDGAINGLTRDALGSAAGIAVVAVGGYGRGDLSPHSDIDLLFVLGSNADVTAATLRGMLYPLWDAGFQVGHAARSPKETVERAGLDLDAATSILSARLVAGDADPFQELSDRRARFLKKEGRRLARRIVDATAARHERVDRAGWSLAPDLKDDAGGLRDVHALGWLAAIAGTAAGDDELDRATELFLATREALHAESKRKLDKLRIDLQPNVARRLGMSGDDAADELMAAVHSAARTIEQTTQAGRDALAERVLGGPKRSGSVHALADGIRMQDGTIIAEPVTGAPAAERALQTLAARSQMGRPIARTTLAWITSLFKGAELQWSTGMRAAFFDLLAGPHVAAALEAVDQVGAWRALLPEWLGIRGRAQHDPYHRYTVDGHSFLAVAEIRRAIENEPLAGEAARSEGDLRMLYLGALLHDVGKGSGEDHSVAGARVAQSACERMGLSEEDVREVVFLVRRHLLLVDTATRRDLEDPSVIAGVAEAIPSPRLLRLLLILSIADGHATGPEGWTAWKSALVGELWHKTMHVLETGRPPTRTDASSGIRARVVETLEPALAGRAEAALEALPASYFESASDERIAADVRMLLRPAGAGAVRHRIDEPDDAGRVTITVVVPDERGTLARTAGVFALHRISVLRAQAYSVAPGHALERFTVAPPAEGALERFVADLEAAYAGRLSVAARLARKISDYRPSHAFEPDVRILQDESEHSTVVEVRAPDTLGLLYAITSGLSELLLDIHVAKIDTLGHRVVDVFYVRSAAGTKLDEEQAAEVARSIEHRVSKLYS